MRRLGDSLTKVADCLSQFVGYEGTTNLLTSRSFWEMGDWPRFAEAHRRIGESPENSSRFSTRRVEGGAPHWNHGADLQLPRPPHTASTGVGSCLRGHSRS